MTKIVLSQLIWDAWNREHIKKHNVSPTEVEEAVSNLLTHRMGHDGKIVLMGRSGKRLIAMIMAQEEGNKYYIVTARDADRKERRLVYEKENKNS
jgi:uncharacterized DUF497 family protein